MDKHDGAGGRGWIQTVLVPLALVATPAVLGLRVLTARHGGAAHAGQQPVVAPTAHDRAAAPAREATSLDHDAPAEPARPARCDADPPADRDGEPVIPATGPDGLPALPVVDACCDDARANATRWLGVEPHVPLAVVDDRGVNEAGGACSAPWARAHSRWRAVDAYGQQVGVAEITGGEYYDALASYELALAPLEGAAGVGLYASASGAWRSPPSARWVPTPAQRAAFEQFLLDADRVLVDHGIARYASAGEHGQDALGARVLFFTVPPREGVTPATPTRFAVGGGAALVVAHVGYDGRWVADHVDNTFSNTYGGSPREAYRPVAVFDLDGDGVPEIVVHTNGGDGWEDRVLQQDDDGEWSDVADSVGGSTA